MRRLFRQFSFPGGVPSHVAPEAEMLGRDLRRTNLVVLHLGNGASATAVAAGESVETSMGLTPWKAW